MISLWNDQETNNFYLINNETGEKQRVYKTGDFIKEFDPSLTGCVGYKARIKLAAKPSYLPGKVKSLTNRYTYYTPKGNKFLWYSQCPRPKNNPELEYFKTTNKSLFTKTQKLTSSFFTSRNSKTMQTTQQSLLEPNKYPQQYKDMSNLFDSKSYDYKKFNSPEPSHFNSKSIREFEQSLKEEKQQLDMFQLPEPQKQCINTKGRFPLDLKTTTDFIKEDKMITKLLFPELFREKVIDQKQEALRRRINKLKEQEMLQRNLKNKI